MFQIVANKSKDDIADMLASLFYILNVTAYLNKIEVDPLIIDNNGCTDGDKTYVINFHAHIQKDVKDSIVSLASKLTAVSLVDEIQGEEGERADVTALRSYLGTLIEEINRDLDKYNVQINLVLEPQELDQISANGSYDPSCEIASPVRTRTENAFSMLQERYDKSIGLHFYIFACLFKNSTFDLVNVIPNSKCGRVVGIMWDGSKNTKTLLKSAIMEALTGSPDIYSKGTFSLRDKNSLCSYAEECIGRSPSQLGQMLEYKKEIRYTKDEDSRDYHSSHL